MFPRCCDIIGFKNYTGCVGQTRSDQWYLMLLTKSNLYLNIADDLYAEIYWFTVHLLLFNSVMIKAFIISIG